MVGKFPHLRSADGELQPFSIFRQKSAKIPQNWMLFPFGGLNQDNTSAANLVLYGKQHHVLGGHISPGVLRPESDPQPCRNQIADRLRRITLKDHIGHKIRLREIAVADLPEDVYKRQIPNTPVLKLWA